MFTTACSFIQGTIKRIIDLYEVSDYVYIASGVVRILVWLVSDYQRNGDKPVTDILLMGFWIEACASRFAGLHVGSTITSQRLAVVPKQYLVSANTIVGRRGIYCEGILLLLTRWSQSVPLVARLEFWDWMYIKYLFIMLTQRALQL